MVCVSPLVQSILERSVMYGDFKMDGGMAAPVEQSFHSPRADLLTTPKWQNVYEILVFFYLREDVFHIHAAMHFIELMMKGVLVLCGFIFSALLMAITPVTFRLTTTFHHNNS